MTWMISVLAAFAVCLTGLLWMGLARRRRSVVPVPAAASLVAAVEPVREVRPEPQPDLTAQLAALAQRLDLVERGLPSFGSLLSDGLESPRDAQAQKMLLSGVSAERTAAVLDMALQETRLLARVLAVTQS